MFRCDVAPFVPLTSYILLLSGLCVSMLAKAKTYLTHGSQLHTKLSYVDPQKIRNA